MQNRMDNKNLDIESVFRDDLHRYLLSVNMVDEILPEAPDLEQRWTEIARSYMSDGIREYNTGYPSVSLGWMMFIGMAMAKYWDVEWETYSKLPDIYIYIRDRIDFDHIDDYILDQVLLLQPEERLKVNDVVAESASRTYSQLCHMSLEHGTAEAYHAYVAALHQMYLMGIAVELKRLGYHMTKVG